MTVTMKQDGAIRPLRASDLPALKAVIAATGLFPPEMLDDMTAPFLAGDAGEERWLTFDDGEEARIRAFYAEGEDEVVFSQGALNPA